MGEWRQYKLADLGRIVTGKTPPTSNPDFYGGEIPFVTPSDMDGRRTIDHTARCLSELGAEKVRSSYIKEAAVVVSCIGSDMGKAALVNHPFVSNQQINSVVVSGDFDRLFVYYNLSARKDEIRDKASGAAQPIMNKSDFGNLILSAPNLGLQRAIASILDAIDEKIELNRRMNETLEAMARAIFKDWFVDFGPTRAKAEGRAPYLVPEIWDLFPDGLDDEDKPLGWKNTTVEQIAEKIALGPFGSNIKVSTFVSEGVPIISGQHLNGTILEEPSFKYITQDHAERLRNSNVYRGDIVFTHAGNIGQVSYIPQTSKYQRYVLSQRQFYLRCNASAVSQIFMVHFFRSSEGQHKLLANASSTGVPSIARPATNLKSIQFCLPARAIISRFDSIATPLHDRICSNRRESEVLAQTRDFLLPKLMSGEIRIKEAEKALEAVA